MITFVYLIMYSSDALEFLDETITRVIFCDVCKSVNVFT